MNRISRQLFKIAKDINASSNETLKSIVLEHQDNKLLNRLSEYFNCKIYVLYTVENFWGEFQHQYDCNLDVIKSIFQQEKKRISKDIYPAEVYITEINGFNEKKLPKLWYANDAYWKAVDRNAI